MSNLAYQKVMTIGINLKAQIKQAKHTCALKPNSQNCRVAWDQVEEIGASLHDYKSNYAIQLKEEEMFGPELPWEDESRFYDI